jgi:hypothetical protein
MNIEDREVNEVHEVHEVHEVNNRKRRRKNIEIKKVWALCVFKKRSDLNQFNIKWGDPSKTELFQKSNKNYYLTRVTTLSDFKIPVAMCVCKSLSTCDRNEFQFEKSISYRELILFCIEKSSVQLIVKQLGLIEMLQPNDDQLISEFLGIESIPQEIGGRGVVHQNIMLPVILPNINIIKTYPIKEAANGAKECSICLVNCATETMSPCGHLCMCYVCMDTLYKSDQINNCIICKSSIFGIQHTFINN